MKKLKFLITNIIFMLICSLNAEEEKNLVRYVSYREIFPAQIRYSSHNVTQKVNDFIAKKAVVWDADNAQWKYKYNRGSSVLSKKQALPVVRASFGYVLADGHHHVLASMWLQAEMIPIKVIKNLEDLDVAQFWEMAEKDGTAYLHAINGERTLPVSSFHDLIDDPNRYFAAITARKYARKANSCTSSGAEHPLWIKINKDIPFIEFKIADALFAGNFIYSAEEMGNPPSDEVVERARKILLAAQVPGLRVIPQRTHAEQIDLSMDQHITLVQTSSG